MQIKGTAVKSTGIFVKENYPDRYEEWLASLKDEVKASFVDGVLAGGWFSLEDYVLEPTRKVGELFFNGDIEKGAYEIGKSSAIFALKGIYKIFVKVASVDFVLKRSTSIFSTYYSGGKFEVIDNDGKRVQFLCTGFDESEKLIFNRIAGWLDGIFSVIAHHADIKFEYKDDENNKLKAEFLAFLK